MFIISWDHINSFREFANGTVYFVFISGFLFQHLSGRYAHGISKYYGAKSGNGISPYLLMLIVWLLDDGAGMNMLDT